MVPSHPALAALNLSIAGTNSTTLGPDFWGADVRVYYPLGAGQAADFNATALQYVRWPGGGVADQYNVTSNTITRDNGTTYAPPSNLTDFVGWCHWVSCQAIIQLPAEIDQPATAAYYVSYIERTVGFHPSYYEIGNEPALWTHFGMPWTSWNTSQKTNATPTSYAQVVHQYAAAILKVSPHARLIGLAGVGTGGYAEPTWIRATVAMNGPNLSAVAIHVYPAGGSTIASNATAFLGALNGHGSVAYRAPRDLAAITTTCPRCHPIALFVSEMGSGTTGGPVDQYMGSFLDVPFLAAEVAQALPSGVQNVDVYAFQSTYNGSLLNGTGATTREFTLYSEILSHLGPGVRIATVSTPSAFLYTTSTVSANGTEHTLLFVNTNLTQSVHFSFLGSGFPLVGSGTAWSWNSPSSAPATTSWTLAVPTVWTAPPHSVLLVQVVV